MTTQLRTVCLSTDDNSFGPQVHVSCRAGFDFTLYFEDLVLTIIPVIVFLLLVPFRLASLYKTRRRKVVGRLLYGIKLTAIGILAVFQLALLLLWAEKAVVKSRASVAAAALTLFGTVVLLLVSHAEHVYSLRPSTLINAYLFVSILCDICRTRTLYLIVNNINHTIATVNLTELVVKIMVLLLETVEKRAILQPLYKNEPPESTSGILNRSLFWWLWSLLRNGSRGMLSMDSLSSLDEDLISETLHGKFRLSWNQDKNTNTRYRLILSSFKTFRWSFISGMFPRLCFTGFKFAQIFLLNRAIRFISEPTTPSSTRIGYGLIGAYAFVYIGSAISNGLSQHKTYRFITMLRGALVTVVYGKTMELDITADKSATLTLMSTDVERIGTGLALVHEMWASMIELGLSIWLLDIQIGIACIAPIVVAIVTTSIALWVSLYVEAKQNIWIKAIQTRVTATASMLEAMKGVKMLGLTDVMSDIIQKLRVTELTLSKPFRLLLICNTILVYANTILSPVAAFVFFSISAGFQDDQSLGVSKAFTSLAILQVLGTSFSALFTASLHLMTAVGCFGRIQDFLLSESRSDYRLLKSELELHGGGDPDDMSRDGSIMLLTLAAHNFAPDKSSQMAAVVTNGSFGWATDQVPQVMDVNISIPASRLTMIVGPVGCGKSTLLHGLLGETPNVTGVVMVASKEIAFCDQTSWLVNGTIQENILGVENFDLDWYNKVLHCCALDQDLSTMTLGDATVVGSKGIMLSGGQKQRIGLARAVYSRKKIMILDDVLSGLDAITENKVFDRLLAPKGLCWQLQTTVILVTHAVHYLPIADHIIAFASTGKIGEGTFDILNESNSYIKNLGISTSGPHDLGHEVANFEEHQALHPRLHGGVVGDVTHDVERQTGDLTVYRYYLHSIGKFHSLLFTGVMCGFVVAFTFSGYWVNVWSTANEKASHQKTVFYLGIYIMLGAISLATIAISVWHAILVIVPMSAERLHWILLESVMRAKMSFLSATDTGITINRFSQDMSLIDMELPMAAYNSFGTFLLVLAQMVFIAITTKYVAIALPFCIGVLYPVQKFYLRTSRQLRFLDLEAKSPLYSHFMESLSGLPTIRAFNFQSANTQKNYRLLNASQRPYYQLYCIQRWLGLSLDMIVAGLAIVLIAICVELRTTISPGLLGLALVNLMSFNIHLVAAVTNWTLLETSIGAVSRVRQFEKQTPSEYHAADVHVEPPVDWPGQGAVEIRDLCLSYQPHSNLVLKNIDLSIPSGTKVGICGRSGSGKSSLLQTLFRLHDPTSGSITIDGFSLTSVAQETVRTRITAIPQDVYIIPNTSLRFNLDPLSNTSDEILLATLRKVRLCEVLNVINTSSLDTVMGEGNFVLSGGQKQLLGLARAIIRGRGLIVLDEATSSVDTETQELMRQLIRTEFQATTVIAVAHRLETILDFDAVAVLVDGAVAEFDQPQALLSRPRSALRSLYDGGQEKVKSRAE